MCKVATSSNKESSNKESRIPNKVTPLSFVAGCFAGSVGTLVGFPLDTLKVFAQKKQYHASLSGSLLFRGCTGPVVSAGCIQAMNLGVYDNCQRFFCSHQSVSIPTPLSIVGFSAFNAGLLISFFTCPLQRVKIVQQLNGGHFNPIFRQLYREGSLYYGMTANVILESAGRALYMMAYVYLKRALASSNDTILNQTTSGATGHLAPEGLNADGHSGLNNHIFSQENCTDRIHLPLWARMFAGGFANTFSWSIIYPLDVIKSVQQAAPAGGRPPSNMLACARELLEEGGRLRLYRGYTYTLLRAGPVAGVLLPLFDLSLGALERHKV
eukprot:CAMPEP_0119319148 /NCGR_PEP_ID=MMETSP1333-20130426/48605_1 /TAXON_ID=418940 /ORGANISM="Scyphosphaera apsteinii, Strain RCC1455" /LENGTH=325 /DNA_ID=CAMNT_0007325489 /DNA_START=127 /DNA_END=1104 /DNA_ORIENTATION=-